jgi:DNA-binding Lrp family transcriptional regulator
MRSESPGNARNIHRLGGFNAAVESQRGHREEERVKAYVLIQTTSDKGPIAEALRHLPGVISAEDLTGPYDAIALARADSSKGLTEQVVAAIERLPGVIRALSAPLIRSLYASSPAAVSA